MCRTNPYKHLPAWPEVQQRHVCTEVQQASVVSTCLYIAPQCCTHQHLLRSSEARRVIRPACFAIRAVKPQTHRGPLAHRCRIWSGRWIRPRCRRPSRFAAPTRMFAILHHTPRRWPSPALRRARACSRRAVIAAHPHGHLLRARAGAFRRGHPYTRPHSVLSAP